VSAIVNPSDEARIKGAFHFTVIGLPQPGGSKRAFPNRKTGGVIVTDANAKAKPWKAAIAASAPAVEALLTGPLAVTCVFYFPRPKGHFGSGKNAGRLKPSAPAHYAQIPDVGKCVRPVFDALEGVLFRNDAQVVEERAYKRWTTGAARADIIIRPLDDGPGPDGIDEEP
jgi:Holliday junction resolvase RusA-like endonuclease